MRQLEEVLIRSRHGTGSAIVATLRGRGSRYVEADLRLEHGAGGDAVTVRTWAVELVTILVTMTEPTACVTRTDDLSPDQSQRRSHRSGDQIAG